MQLFDGISLRRRWLPLAKSTKRSKKPRGARLLFHCRWLIGDLGGLGTSVWLIPVACGEGVIYQRAVARVGVRTKIRRNGGEGNGDSI